MHRPFNTTGPVNICRIRYNVLKRHGEPADTTVLETEMKNNVSDQENSKNDADSI